jgi:uncharacterized protein YeaO (DUF488 family)
MVKTKSVYDPAEQSDGERMLVSQYWPRGFSKGRLGSSAWLRNLAPSRGLLQPWKAGSISWEEYVSRYHEEMSAHKKEIEELAEKARAGTITLLCFEREGNPCCHRHLLKRLIEKSMADTEEPLSEPKSL